MCDTVREPYLHRVHTIENCRTVSCWDKPTTLERLVILEWTTSDEVLSALSSAHAGGWVCPRLVALPLRQSTDRFESAVSRTLRWRGGLRLRDLLSKTLPSMESLL